MAAPEVCLPKEEKMTCGNIDRPLKNGPNPDENDVEMMEEMEFDNREAAKAKKEAGNKHYAAKEYSKAVEYYTEAIELDNSCAAYYGNRAAAFMMMEKFDRALEDARKACSLDSSFVKAYHRAAKCYIATGQTSSALRTLEQAHELEPKNKVISQELRNVKSMIDFESQAADAFEIKEYRKVEYCMRKLLEFAPSCLSYRSLQAECLALTGRYGEAQRLANDILQKDALHVESLYVRGLCLYYQDQTERAYKVLQQVLRIAPDFKKAREAYKKAKSLENSKEAGNNAFRSQNFAEAQKLYSEALTIDPLNKSTNSKIYCNRATANFKLKRFDECIEDCTKAIELDPTYLKAYLRRAKCYMDTEQYQEAVHDYEKITRMDHNREYRQLLSEAKRELKKSQRKDYYKILGVPKTADDAQLKKAYRKEALKHHPDRHSNADEKTRKQEEVKFKDVNEAYSVLSDKVKRQRYDNGQDLDGGGFDFGGDFDPNIIFQSFFGGGGGGFSQNFSQRGGSGFTFTFG